MKIVCYGDSNTYGFDPRDGGRYPANARWPELLHSRFGIETANEGLNGRTIPIGGRGYELLRKMLARYESFDTLTIMLGTNDIFRIWEPDAEKVTSRLRNLFANVPELRRWVGGERRVLLLAPPPLVLPDTAENAAYLRTAEGLSEAYAAFAQEYGLDFFDVAAIAPRMAFDGVHLSEEGHRQLAEVLGKVLLGLP